ncbi:MAG TPA: hypothetical protein VFX70_07345 [Mycobacteriales bacterium]|nr:hypothetical protein [Mycobacteriales bacterium]
MLSATAPPAAGATGVGGSMGGGADGGAAGTTAGRACPQATRPGRMSCQAVIRPGTPIGPAGGHADAPRPGAVRPNATPGGFGPADLHALYHLPGPPAGAGRTVAVVDAMDDPNAEADLATYRSTFGLTACTTANGCFRKVNQNGAPGPLPASDPGWGLEVSLDLDMVSAVCPACHILLVEATSPATNNLGAAENTAVRLGAHFIGNSYGEPEFPGDQTIGLEFYDHPGVAITAPSGDSGFGVDFPASAVGVTAVGATTLSRDLGNRTRSEAAYSGGGCASSPKPPWQQDTFCATRTLVDVAAIGDPNIGVAVYDTFGEPGFVVVGGVSVSAQIIAAVYALAGIPPVGSQPASFPYAHPGDLNDITRGPGAGPGYDEPTGMGTPNGVAAFRSP